MVQQKNKSSHSHPTFIHIFLYNFKYRDNKIQRLDIDILKRICYVLECDLHDLIEYIPPKN